MLDQPLFVTMRKVLRLLVAVMTLLNALVIWESGASAQESNFSRADYSSGHDHEEVAAHDSEGNGKAVVFRPPDPTTSKSFISKLR